MVRLGLMAMAMQLRPEGQSRATAAAMGRCPSLSGGYSPGKPFSADYVDALDLRQEQDPTKLTSGDVEWNLIIEAAYIDEHGNAYLEVLRNKWQGFVTHPTMEEKTAHEDADETTCIVGAWPTTAIDAVTWKGTGAAWL